MPAGAMKIYSVGVSTAGLAEIRMAKNKPDRHVIASTIDQAGADFAAKYIAEQNASNQVDVKIEDVTKSLPYQDNQFDYVYARLVLHYLAIDDLVKALAELHRIVKSGGKIYIVVRSTNCPDYSRDTSKFDPETHLTTYVAKPNPNVPAESQQRFFHSKESISEFVSNAGFRIEYAKEYEEQLFADFKRSVHVTYKDSVIELLAAKP